MENNPVDPETIIRVDGLVLERTSHYLRLAPFLIIVHDANNSAILKPVNHRSGMTDWNPPRNSRVCGVFGTFPTSSNNHTIGLFAINSYFCTNVKEIIIYVIDGKDHEDDEDYLQCRNAAVDCFKTRIMNVSSSRPHSIRVVDFSYLSRKDRMNSSLHVRQCFRELAGYLSVSSLITSAKVLSNLVNDGFSLTTSTVHAFHSEAKFDGVRLQIAKRCWTKDLEDAVCFLLDENSRYAGSYGSEVTAPLDDDEEGLEARNARQLVATLCANALCDKPAKKKCPKCAELGLSRTRYCGHDCFKTCWRDHELLHKQAEAYQRQQQPELQDGDGYHTCDDGDDSSVDGEDNANEVMPANALMTNDSLMDGNLEVKIAEAVPKVDLSETTANDSEGRDNVESRAMTKNDSDEAKPAAVLNKTNVGFVARTKIDLSETTANDSEGRDKVESRAMTKSDSSEGKPAAVLNKTNVGFVARTMEVATNGALLAVATKPAGVRITGAMGSTATTINGVFEPMKLGVYRKAGNVRLEYRAPCKQWQVKIVGGTKTTVLAVCDVPVKCSIYECLKRRWHVAVDGKHVHQPAVTISMASKEEVAACHAEVEREAACVAKGIYNVRIAGASGTYGYSINGVYSPTDKMMIYDKVGGSFILEYYAPNSQWQIKLCEHSGKDESCNAYLTVSSQCLPHQCPSRRWQVWDGSKHVSQPAVTISMATNEEVEAYLAEVDEEAARLVKGICSVRVTGATGISAASVNGTYEPMDEMCRNATVYRKTGDDTMWMEYNASSVSWQVKPIEHKGTNICYAWCAVPSKCLPEECPLRRWQVAVDGKHKPHPSVSVSVVSEEEVAAYRAEVEHEADRVVKGDCSVCVIGAKGNNAGHVNGTYEPTDEMYSNATVFRKVGDSTTCMEYHASSRSWQIKSTANKGQFYSYALCEVPAKSLPHSCPLRRWQVAVDGIHVSQPSVSISMTSEDKVAAIEPT